MPAKKADMRSMHMKSSPDLKFATEAAQGGMEEVELGKIVAQKAQDDKEKQFGQRMVDDHSKSNDELKSIASKNNITLPSELDAKHKAMVDKFNAMPAGTAFDKAYVANMVKDHQKDVADFQKESDSGLNADVKAFATKTLPTLQDHLKMVQELHAGMHGSIGKK